MNRTQFTFNFSEPESSQDRTPTYVNQNYPISVKSTLQPNYPIPIRNGPIQGYSSTSPKSIKAQQQGFVRRGEQGAVSIILFKLLIIIHST